MSQVREHQDADNDTFCNRYPGLFLAEEDVMKLSITGCFFFGLLLLHSLAALGGQVKIVDADFSKDGTGKWSISVTLHHDDAGWDHYADQWRVVDTTGAVIGKRVLYHPHVNEQPFTRSLHGISLPQMKSELYIEAHDSVHGWTPNRLKVEVDAVSADKE